MSMYLGPFYIRDSDGFILIALVLTLVTIFLNIPIPFIDSPTLLLLTILFLLARGMLPLANAGKVYIIFLTSLFASAIVPLSVVFMYLVISFVLLRITRQL